MLSPQSTTQDWQEFTGEVCILPVGSLEQHSAHLPLDTDIVEAAFFAKLLAEDLGAALLPVLAYGTCAEHTGFRGSISLRPETQMQLVRDIADEVEAQQFKVLILLNSHGGNFSLAPAARWINRANRPLKVLLVNWYEFVAPGILEAAAHGPEIHAGEMETSVMLVIAPETVRAANIPSAANAPKLPAAAGMLKQSDLNTFGAGHFNPAGYIGFPWLGTREKGEAVIESVRHNMAAHVRERLALLEKGTGYTGTGAVAVRPLQIQDLEAGMRLKAAAHWNQTAADWQFLLEGEASGFAAARNGRVVGTVTTLHYPDGTAPEVTWIGMMLVDPEFRSLGIGRRLMKQALEGVPKDSIIGLDATAAGQPLYETLGFRETDRIYRLTHRLVPRTGETPDSRVRPVKATDLPTLTELDARAFGVQRGRLLAMLAESPLSAWCFEEDGEIRAFCLGRPGANFHQLGPLVAETEEQALSLVQRALRELAQRSAVIDVPVGKTGLVEWLVCLGFAREREFARMLHGGAGLSGEAGLLWAIAGPELG